MARSKLEPVIFNHELVKTILDKMGRDDRHTEKSLATLTFKQLYALITTKEAKIIRQLLVLKPKGLGFLGPFVSMDEPPSNLISIKDQKYIRDEEEKIIVNQYLPAEALRVFQQLADALRKDIGSTLMVESGYRSPACQAITFLTYLEMNNFNIKMTTTRVALPGYSQHGDPYNTAVDVINQDGIPTDENPLEFEKTKEYNWLSKNAQRFNFYLSYPRDNNQGVKFEPWHWRYRG